MQVPCSQQYSVLSSGSLVLANPNGKVSYAFLKLGHTSPQNDLNTY